MARRKKKRGTEEEHENLERWLVSYSDFMTLLFAFFVVLYAMSAINVKKAREVSNAITVALQAGNLMSNKVGVFPDMQSVKPTPLILSVPAYADDELHELEEKMQAMAREMRTVLSPLIEKGEVRVADKEGGIEIDINARLLFESGQADLAADALPPLRSVAQVLAQASFPIKVEGHTDNIGIATPQFPSNWELSSARAARVVRVLIDADIDAGRLVATGYADQRPIAGNETAEGRLRNRRVAIIIEMPTLTKSASALGLSHPGAEINAAPR